MGRVGWCLVLLAAISAFSLFGSERQVRNLRETLASDGIPPGQLTVCLNTTYGRNFNMVITLANAIHYAEVMNAVVVLADTTWVQFYRLWFKVSVPRLRLRPDGFKCDIAHDAEAHFFSRTLHLAGYEPFQGVYRPQFNRLVLKSALLKRGQYILDRHKSFPGQPVVTVHQRWLEGECYERHQHESCCFGNSQYNFTCEYTADIVKKNLPPEFKNATLVLLGDGQRQEAESTFEIVDTNPFAVQAAMMVVSDYHFGNPVSSIDGIIAHWRKGRKQFPELCYSEIMMKAGNESYHIDPTYMGGRR